MSPLRASRPVSAIRRLALRLLLLGVLIPLYLSVWNSDETEPRPLLLTAAAEEPQDTGGRSRTGEGSGRAVGAGQGEGSGGGSGTGGGSRRQARPNLPGQTEAAAPTPPSAHHDERIPADGITDVSEALQQWVQNGTNGQRLRRGTYRISRTIVVNLDETGWTSLHGDGVARILMTGPGPAFRIIGSHEGTADPDSVQPNVWDRQRMPVVDGVEIVGAHPEASGIELDGTMQATITRLTVRDCLHAIHVVRRNRNVQISDCHLYDNRGIGVYLDGVNLHQINIVGCHISYNDQGGIVCRNSEIRNLQVGTCDIEGNMAPDAAPTANVFLDCRTGSVREAAITGCTIQHNHDSPESANVRLLGAGPENERQVGNLTISDNVFSDVRTNVHLKYARGVTLTGNTFWHGYDHNLLVEESTHIVVGPNLFDRNPDYNYTREMSRNAIVFDGCRDCTLMGLHVHHVVDSPAAVTLRSCRWVNITGCTLLDSDGWQLALEGCADCRVSNCLIADRRDTGRPPQAVEVRTSRNIHLGDNTLVGQTQGAD
jgi:hypothetical protein